MNSDTRSFWLYRFLRPAANVLIHILYRPTIVGAENIPKSGGAVLCGNHRHAFDPILPIAATKRTNRFLAKIELFHGVFDPFFRGIGCIPVDRSRRDRSATDAAEAALRGGSLVCIFPEGTRNRTEAPLLPLKYGAVSLAHKTGCVIVPFGTVGTFRIFRKGPVVTFGEPFHVISDDLDLANSLLRSRILELTGQADSECTEAAKNSAAALR